MKKDINIFLITTAVIGCLTLLIFCIIFAGYFENHKNNQVDAYTIELYSALTAIATFLSTFVAILALRRFTESIEIQKKELTDSRAEIEFQNTSNIIFEYKKMLNDIKTRNLTAFEEKKLRDLNVSDTYYESKQISPSLKFTDFLWKMIQHSKINETKIAVEQSFSSADAASMGNSDRFIKYFYAQIKTAINSSLPEEKKSRIFEIIFSDTSNREMEIYDLHIKHLCTDQKITDAFKKHTTH